MAAIATLHTFGGTGFTGFTNAGGTLTESGGSAVPSTPSSDSSLYYNTANTEVSNSTRTTGTVAKITLSGGLETGSKVRVWLGTDEDNNVYAELTKGGVTVFADVLDDVIRLGRRTGGVDSDIMNDTPLQYMQLERGHLRHYVMQAGDSFSITKVLDQYIVKYSPTDPIDNRDTTVEDVIILSESDGAATAASTKMGFTLKGGTHTNGIALFQGGNVNVKFTQTTGSDTNNGTYTSPYKTLKKLMENVGVGEIGFIRGGTYSEGVGEGGNSPFNSTFADGTMWEDAPLFMPYGEEAVQQNYGGGVAHYYVKGFLKFRYLYNWVMDGQDSALDIIKVWGQGVGGTGVSNHHMRLHRMTARKVGGHSGITNPGSAISLGFGVSSGTPSGFDLDKYHHFLDCNISDNDYVSASKTGGTGMYSQGSYFLMEYCQTSRNYGDGYKIFDSGHISGTPAYTTCNYNVVRYHRSDANRFYGGLNTSGTGNITHSGIYSHSTDPSSGSGIMIGYGGLDALVYNNLCYGNAAGGISIEVHFGPFAITGAKVLNNTSYGNKWNFQIVGTALDVITPLFMNNTAYGALMADFRNTATSTPTFTTNHETASTGFGSVFGNPLYMNTATKDFRLQDGSPLKTAGSDASANLSKDFERKPLPQGSWHIGAYAIETPVGLTVINPSTTPALSWSAQGGVAKTRIFVEWSGNKRWWEATDDATAGVQSNGSGAFNVISNSPLALPASVVKFSIRQYDGGGSPLESETAQIEWNNT